MDDYKDILNLSRPVSKRPKMSLIQRAAQFAPFAALTGYESQVKETSRLTNKKIEIDEEIKLVLDLKIKLIQDRLKENPIIKITYFIPDLKKEGGKYEVISNIIKMINLYENEIIMIDGTVIPIENIIDIQSDIFRQMNF